MITTKIITAFFTVGGVPTAGLTPTIDIIQLNVASEVSVVSGGSVVGIGGGWYRYNFTTYDTTKTYVFTIDGGVALPNTDRYQYGGNDSFVEDIADNVWDEAISSHQVVGSTGEAVIILVVIM